MACYIHSFWINLFTFCFGEIGTWFLYNLNTLILPCFFDNGQRQIFTLSIYLKWNLSQHVRYDARASFGPDKALTQTCTKRQSKLNKSLHCPKRKLLQFVSDFSKTFRPGRVKVRQASQNNILSPLGFVVMGYEYFMACQKHGLMPCFHL